MTEAVLRRERWSPEPAGSFLPAVLRISLTAFRCYAAARLDVDARPVVLSGPNGAGKTNLLEAVSFLVPGRGLRRARLADVMRRTTPDQPVESWAVAARASTAIGMVDSAPAEIPPPTPAATGGSCGSTAPRPAARRRSPSTLLRFG